MFRSILSLFLVCLGTFPATGASLPSSHPGGFRCGTEPGRLVTELFRHRQSERRRQTEALTADQPRAPLPDIGNIAIVDDSEGAVVRPNLFDLRQRTLHFQTSGPTASQYTVSPDSIAFDTAAADGGSPFTGLQDDDARLVRFPFSFPFYGQRYDSVYVNSDGNLTFTTPDTEITSRNLSRAISGSPRIFPFFDDLDPSQPDATVKFFAASDRVVVTWDRVPEYSARGTGTRVTFQVAFFPDGRIDFHYRDIPVNEAVVGIAPGQLRNDATSADFSQGLSTPASGAIAEIFSANTDVDTTVVARKFFRNHDDAYDYIVLFNNMGLPPGPGAFAFLLHVRNRVRGIGNLLRQDPIFDFGSQFGSPFRLQSFLNLGPLANYPADPTQVIPVFASSRNTAVTIMGQESGHRFLAYARFLDPQTNQKSMALLGRDNAHWSFFFNTDASVVEGNRIEDRGEGQSPRFRTTGTVEKYSAFDQYLMGFRPAPDAPPSFVVRNPSSGFPADGPRVGATFDGTRQDITVQMIIDAEGRRIPDSTVAQRHFNYALVLLVREGTQPNAEDLSQVERFRTEWERFFGAAAENRGAAHTGLVKQLRLSTWPAGGLVRGIPGTATISVAAALSSNLEVTLTTDAGTLSAPASVTIPAGRTSASFGITGNRAGFAELAARTADPAYDVSRTIVQVRDDATPLQLDTVSGGNQKAARGASLSDPIVLRLRDENEVPYSGVPVSFLPNGNGTATPARAVTDPDGRVSVSWRLSTDSANTLRASVDSAASVSTVITATALDRAAFTAAGVVNAASFNTGAISAGGLLSIFGVGLAGETRTASGFPLPSTLAGTSVTVGGIAAPLLYVSPGQINLQAPYELSGSTADIVVTTSAGPSSSIRVALAGVQPGIFFDTATGLGAILHNADGVPVSQQPARPGEFLQVYATGLGPVSPAVFSGFAAPLSPLSRISGQPQVTIAGRSAAIAFSGLAPGFAGLYQLTIQVPDGVPAGRQAVSLTIGGLRSNEVFLNVQ